MSSRWSYADVWWATAAVVAGVGAAVVELHAAALAPTALAVVLAAVVLGRMVLRAHGRAARATSSTPAVAPVVWQTFAVMLGGSVALVVAGVGWDALFGPAGAAVVVGVALAGVPLVRWDMPMELPAELHPGRPAGRRAADPGPAGPAGPDPGPAVPAVPAPRWPTPMPPARPPEPAGAMLELTDAELWHAWHESTRALALARSPQVRARIVAVRQRYLDALVERDPNGFAREFDASAGGGTGSAPE